MLRCRIASSAVARAVALPSAAAFASLGVAALPCAAVTAPVAAPVFAALPVCAARFAGDDHGEAKQDPRKGPVGAVKQSAYLLDKVDVLTRVTEVVKNFEKVDASKVTPESHFINDLGLDSLDVVEVVMALEQEFVLDIPDHEAEKIQSIPDAVEYLCSNPMAK
jgi:acyl carrier protein